MKEKLEEIKSSIQNYTFSSNFKGMYIVADFAKMRSVEEYRTQISNKLKDLNIGLLILNAGVGTMGPFD